MQLAGWLLAKQHTLTCAIIQAKVRDASDALPLDPLLDLWLFQAGLGEHVMLLHVVVVSNAAQCWVGSLTGKASNNGQQWWQYSVLVVVRSRQSSVMA